MNIRKALVILTGLMLLVSACTPGFGLPSAATPTRATEEAQVPVTGGTETGETPPPALNLTIVPGTESPQKTETPGGLSTAEFPAETGTEAAETGTAEASPGARATVTPAITQAAPTGPAETIAPTEVIGGGLPLEAFLLVQQLLTNTLNVAMEAIPVRAFEQVDWADACLELPAEGEACAEAVTPGFWLVLEVRGEPFEFRTDTSVGNIRVGAGGSRLQSLALQAQLLLSTQFGVDISELRVVSLQRMTFPDSCLGAGQPNQSCLAEPTPGFQLVFEAGGQTFEFRASETGQLILVPGQ